MCVDILFEFEHKTDGDTQTEDAKWMTPINGILGGTLQTFFPRNKIMEEVGCEPENACTTDGLTFKSFTLRWMVLLAQLVPETAEQIWPYIQASAQGAAGQCDGAGGSICGYHWQTTTWDGTTGVGQQMSALAAVQANLLTVDNLAAPLTLETGGTSKSDPNAGNTGSTSGSSTPGSYWQNHKATTGDKAGAGILTALALIGTLGGTYWLVSL